MDLLEALSWYADPETWRYEVTTTSQGFTLVIPAPAETDRGEKARKTLENNKVKDLLNEMKKYPGMYASTKEAYLSAISTILILIGPKVEQTKFYQKHLGSLGSLYIGLTDPVTDVWAHNVIDDAMEQLWPQLMKK